MSFMKQLNKLNNLLVLSFNLSASLFRILGDHAQEYNNSAKQNKGQNNK